MTLPSEIRVMTCVPWSPISCKDGRPRAGLLCTSNGVGQRTWHDCEPASAPVSAPQSDSAICRLLVTQFVLPHLSVKYVSAQRPKKLQQHSAHVDKYASLYFGDRH